MLDSDRLLAYSERFFGYGNPKKAKLWFVGIEEGGGKCEHVIDERLTLWETEFKRRTFIDGMQFHRRLRDCDGNSLERLFRDPPANQKTWDRLIRVQLAYQRAGSVSNADVQATRCRDWTRSSSSSCLLELLPLPSPTTSEWRYAQWTKSDVFQTRRAYARHVIPHRTPVIKDLIKNYRPQVIVFYGTTHLPRWSEIAGLHQWNTVSIAPEQRFTFQRDGETLFVAISHPTARGISLDYFEKVGKEIRRRTR